MTTNEAYRERKTHGNAEFPFDIYACLIPDDLPEVMDHWHDEVELIYIIKGAGIIRVDADTREVTGPALVLVLPGQLHAIRRIGREPLEYRNILFHPDMIYSKKEGVTEWEYLRPFLDGHLGIPSFIDPSLPAFRHLIEPIEAFGEKVDRTEDGYPLMVKSQLYLLLYRILKNVPRKTDGRVRGINHRIKPILTYMMEHYSESITVAEAASVVGFSEAHFMRFFRENMGVSFITYLRGYRLSKAEELIRTTDDSILSIAEDTGFPSLSYFIQHFGKKYGMTPLQYRKALTKK